VKVRLCEDSMLLTQPGDYAIERGAEIIEKLIILCPSCLTRCSSSVGVITERPLTLSSSLSCAHCYTDYCIYDGKIEPETGTLPPWVRWESSHQYDDHKYR
jgi:hypothetical protein